MLADWTKIAAVKAALRIPVITNGNIRGLEDCHAALRETGCDGVMSGCGVLASPSLFVGGRLTSVESALLYIDYATRYSAHPKAIVKHLQTILGRGWLAEHAQIRALVVAYRGEEEQPGALGEIETAIRRAGVAVA